jgi:DNA helicase-2/ATP-dependent DNA helicase PcrA
MEEGLFPHSRSLDNPIDLEEERRLCYVGMTRAKERLYLLYADSRLIFGSRQFTCPSRFISELPEHLVDKL